MLIAVETKRKTIGFDWLLLYDPISVAHLHPCHAILGVVSQVSKVWVEESYDGEGRCLALAFLGHWKEKHK